MAVYDHPADAPWFALRRCNEVESEIQPIGVVVQPFDAYRGDHSIFV